MASRGIDPTEGLEKQEHWKDWNQGLTSGLPVLNEKSVLGAPPGQVGQFINPGPPS